MLKNNKKFSMEFINEEDFKNAMKIADEIVIGHPDCAEYFGTLCNRKTIHLDDGDVLYVCELNNETGNRLPSGTEFIEQLGDGFYFRFLKIEVIK
jgi:hypothetical protein